MPLLSRVTRTQSPFTAPFPFYFTGLLISDYQANEFVHSCNADIQNDLFDELPPITGGNSYRGAYVHVFPIFDSRILAPAKLQTFTGVSGKGRYGDVSYNAKETVMFNSFLTFESQYFTAFNMYAPNVVSDGFPSSIPASPNEEDVIITNNQGYAAPFGIPFGSLVPGVETISVAAAPGIETRLRLYYFGELIFIPNQADAVHDSIIFFPM